MLVKLSISLAVFSQVISAGYSGAIYSSTIINITNFVFSNNTANSAAGAIYFNSSSGKLYC